MRFTKKIPYNIRRVLPILGIAGASVFSACSSKDDEPQRDIEIYLYDTAIDNPPNKTIEELRQYAADESIRNIYLIPCPTDNHMDLEAHNITFYRNNFLAPRVAISPKIKGRGSYRFKTGVPSQVPEDSLWYELHGWRINPHLHQQKQR